MVVRTECAHCSEPMQLEIDSDLNHNVREKGAAPVVFIPQVDFHKLEDPSIIDSF